MAGKTWKPRCALRVGVLGNRNFNEEAMKTIARRRAEEIWREIFDSIPRVLGETHGGVRVADLFSTVTPRVAVLSSLAKGGDQILTKAAFPNQPAGLELEAVLPFVEAHYPAPEDFDPEDIAEFHVLIEKNEVTQIVRFDGDYSSEASRVAAYRQAADHLLQNSDLVIAAYDPTRQPLAAGTVKSIVAALQYNTPVIAIELDGPEGTVKIARSLVKKQPQWDAEPDWRTGVERCVREQLVPSELLGTTSEEEGHNQYALRRLQMVTGDTPLPWLCASDARSEYLGSMWPWLRKVTMLGAPLEAKEKIASAEASPPPDDGITLSPYKELDEAAEGLASRFMGTYRGAFVLTYLLAGLAVAAAVLILVLQHYELPHFVVWGLCGIKIAILVLLFRLESAGHKDRLHEAAADFRYVTELLRPMPWLSRGGLYPPAADLPLHTTSDDMRRSWMAWLVRAAARSCPSVSDGAGYPHDVTITRDRTAAILDDARTRWIAGQVRYHDINRARMEALGEGLENEAKTLLVVVLIAAIAACALELFDIATPWAVGLGALAAILPAFVAAAAGISFQSEAKRLAKRSAAMARVLRDRQKQLQDLAVRLRRNDANCDEAAALLQELSGIMLTETADWKILYQAHEIRAG